MSLSRLNILRYNFNVSDQINRIGNWGTFPHHQDQELPGNKKISTLQVAKQGIFSLKYHSLFTVQLIHHKLSILCKGCNPFFLDNMCHEHHIEQQVLIPTERPVFKQNISTSFMGPEIPVTLTPKKNCLSVRFPLTNLNKPQRQHICTQQNEKALILKYDKLLRESVYIIFKKIILHQFSSAQNTTALEIPPLGWAESTLLMTHFHPHR